METLKQIENWFKQAVPNPIGKNKLMQISCHNEEFIEMIKAVTGEDIKDIEEHLVTDFRNDINTHPEYIDVALSVVDKDALLDSLCDQIVTAIGVAYMFGFDIQGALSEVNASNWSKFEDGKPIFNEQGKIIKGKDYFKPNLKPFLGENK